VFWLCLKNTLNYWIACYGHIQNSILSLMLLALTLWARNNQYI